MRGDGGAKGHSLPHKIAQKCMGMEQSKKGKEGSDGVSSYGCAPPDSGRACGHNGMFFVLPGNYHDAAQVADSNSPAFIRIQN